MKKNYEKPMADRVNFSYEEQIVAQSGTGGVGTKNNNGVGDECNHKVEGCVYPA